jgi:hypothetical protein
MKTITISLYIDVISALSANNLSGCLYGLDNNKRFGSLNEGTASLITKVNKGDKLVWNSSSIEPESFSEITEIHMDPEYCEVEKHYYPGSDIVFWTGIVIKQPDLLDYSASIVMGHNRIAFCSEPGLRLKG